MAPEEPPIWAHFRSPRNTGVLGPPARHGRAENRACGDVLDLYVLLDGERVVELRFQARACSSVIAAASLATEALRGKSVAEARLLDVRALVDAAGGVPRQKSHAPDVIARALAEALADPRQPCQA
jgi:nitrogen fixation protein NifU and related proteins